MDITKQIEEGFNQLEAKASSKIEKDLIQNMKKYEDELRVNGEASREAKQAVEALSKQMDESIRDLSQQMTGFKGAAAAHNDTAGESLVKSEEFKNLLTQRGGSARVEVKTTTSSIVGTTVFPQNNAGVVPGIFQPLTIRQILPSGRTDAISVVGIREKIADYSNKAAGVAQAGAKPESGLGFEQFNTPIETVATWLKVSNQLLADAPTVVSYIDTRLRFMLAETVNDQLLNGAGTSPQLKGLTKNATAYAGVKGDNLADAINKAKYQLWAKGYAPDFVAVNPADWSILELAKDTMGRYLYGTPGTVGGTTPFGVPVVLSNQIAAGNILIGNAAQAAMLWDRQTTVVEAGYVNTDFTSNLVTLRAEERLGLEIHRPEAILYGAFSPAAAEK